MQSNERKTINAAQLRAARALLGISAEHLAVLSNVGVATIRRAEAGSGTGGLNHATASAIFTALDQAGIDFIPENGGGAGVRLRGA